MPKQGDSWLDVHANTDPYESDIERGVRLANEAAEDDLKTVGKDFGDTLSKSMGDELEKSGPDLAKSVEKGIGKQKVRTKVQVEYDKDNNVIRRFVERTTDDIEDAFDKAAAPGGPFNRIGRGIADAIGAGFNVSGKSPLIAFLVPLVGVIIGLVVAALQAVNALVAVLATLPALLAGIGLQVGVVAIAFQGMGEAISGAFAAKNAKELNEAIKGLTPSAQKFVKELLPLKSLFEGIQRRTQEAFFLNLGSIIPQLQQALQAPFLFGFKDLAAAMGQLFRDIALFFASPNFVKFVNTLFPATIEFLKFFGPNFIKFLDGLVQMSTAILPFLNTLGRMLSGTLFQLGDFFQRIVRDGSLQKWLDSMTHTLQLVLELFAGVVEFVTVFLAQLDKAGGAEVIQALIDAFNLLTFFLSTDVGVKAMEGLIDLAKISIAVFTGLILTILLVLAALESLAEWINNVVIPAIGDFFKWIGNAGEAIGKFFANLGNSFTTTSANLIRTAAELPGKLLGALGDMGSLLINAGQRLIDGFINGIRSKAQSLINTVSGLIGQVMSFFPGSPAEQGPLSGQGYSLYRGQRMMEDFARGIQMEIPTVRSASTEATSNVIFGPNSIRVGFEGALPTQEQAQQTGAAVGNGINSQLARNTRLAVRTL